MFYRKAAKYALACTGAAGVTVSLVAFSHVQKELESLRRAFKENSEKPEVELRGTDAMVFPWSTFTEDWELRRVKLIGVFLKDRYFVRKELNGVPGFLIFKPFVTAYAADVDFLIPEEEHRMARPRGILVNIGWVAADSVRNFEEPPLGRPFTVEPDVFFPAGKTVTDGATNLEFQVVEEGGEVSPDQPCPVAIEGYLRRPERRSPLAGKWQDARIKQRNFVELRQMLRNVFFDNIDDAEQYYLDLRWEGDAEETPVLRGPSTPQEVLSTVEEMEKGSHVYRMKKYIAAGSALLLLSSILL